jgi:hypothetical protein
MSATEVQAEPSSGAGGATADLKLEVVMIPVSDVDRAKEFYRRQCSVRLSVAPV